MDDVVGAAGEILGALLLRDHVVRRRHDRRQIGPRVAKRAERADVGHATTIIGACRSGPRFSSSSARLSRCRRASSPSRGPGRSSSASPPGGGRGVGRAEPRAGEVLVRLAACGVCHTDLYTASGADPSGYAPAVLGHEGAGVVERVGDGVSTLAEGDHVVSLFSPQCGECIHCRSPKTNLCLAIREQQNQGHLPDGTTRLSRDGEPIRHFMGCSTFAEYTVMPEIALARISPDAAPEMACLFACGLSTGLGAAMYTAKV